MIGTSFLNRANTKRRLLGIAIGLFGLAAATACTGLEGLDAAAAQAIVQNVDSLSGEVTVQFKDGTTTTFNLADVDVEALGQLIGEASLQAGDEIEVELDASNSVRSVTPHVAVIQAMIVEVDTEANTLLLEAQNGVQLLLTLTAQTKIEFEGHDRGTVDNLLPNLLVKVKYNTGTDEALKIKHKDGDDNDDEHEVKGVITAIDTEDHKITVEDDHGAVEIHAVHSDTEIKIDGHAPFGELEVGMLVKLEFDDDSLALEEIEVKTEDDGEDHGRGHDDDDDEGELKGAITVINAEDHTITVEDLDGGVETYTAHSDTEIELRGHAAFGDLEVGMQVKIEFEIDSLVLNGVEVRVEGDEHARNDEHGDAHDEEDDEDEDHV